jgi:hypothetical protein
MRGYERRLAALERRLIALAPGWLTLARWRSAHADKLTLSEAEQRDLGAYGEDSAAIIAHYERVRERRKEAEETMAIFA